MTLMEFFGCAFIAFGPPFSMFIWTIATEPLKVIIFIAGAFFWLLSLLMSSLIWYAVVPLRSELAFGLVFSVILQELFRYAYYLLLRKAESGLQKFTDTGASSNVISLSDSRHALSYVAGMGFGVMSGAFSLVNVLADASGPGTVGIHGDRSNFFVVSAFLTLCFILLHVCWSVLFFHSAYIPDNNLYKWGGMAFVLGVHMLCSCLTLVNASEGEMYYTSLVVNYAILVVMAVLALRTAGLSVSSLKAFCSATRSFSVSAPSTTR